MSASEYLPLYQPFTNRTHIRNGRRFNQSEISQIIEKNICCGVILSGNVCGYLNLSIIYILVSVCPADGITSRCPIWIDAIKKWISKYGTLPYNARASMWWTPFCGGILGCKKGVLKLIAPESESWEYRVWLPTSITKLVIEFNGSRHALLRWYNAHVR